MDKIIMWVVGEYFGQHKESSQSAWSLVGIFDTEEAARAECEGQSENYFLGPIQLNDAQHDMVDWPECEYPNVSREADNG